MATATPRSPYDVLGLAPGASAEAIKQAYRTQAQRHHPDKHPDDPGARERFQAIQAAYQALTRAESSPVSASPFDMQSAFDDLFAQVFQGQVARRVELVLALEDVLSPSIHTLVLPDGQPAEARLPAGLDHGDRVRLWRNGRELPGWQAVIRMAAHPIYAREGADLFRKLTCSYAQLVLGGPLTLEVMGRTLEGQLPAGRHPGHRVRVPGYGLPTPHGERGDLYLELAVEIPTTLTAAQKKAVAALDKKLHPVPKTK